MKNIKQKLRSLIEFFNFPLYVWATIIAIGVLIYSAERREAPREPIGDLYGYVLHAPRDAHVEAYNAVQWHSLCLADKQCVALAEAGYFEARNQSDEGVFSVMKTVLNRVEHRRWGSTIRGVVYEGCQFSYNCDGSRERGIRNEVQWNRMLTLAYKLTKGHYDVNLSSTHYHTKSVKPVWSRHYEVVAIVDDHIFYECKVRC